MIITTRTKGMIDLSTFSAPDIRIQDIALGLSRINRYNGHTPQPYTVAQHSVLAAHLAPPDYMLEVLMHDAAEAYVGDILKPIKDTIPAFNELEERILFTIWDAFALQTGDAWSEVKRCDVLMLQVEMSGFVTKSPGRVSPFFAEIWDAARAEREFLDLFEALTEERAGL